MFTITTKQRKLPIKSELATPEEREAKIQEMAARGFVVRRTYEYEKETNQYVSTGYHGAKYRYAGNSYRKVYGVIFKSVDE